MIILTRKVGQHVYLAVGDKRIVVKVMESKGSIVRLGIAADLDVLVDKTLKDHLERSSNVAAPAKGDGRSVDVRPVDDLNPPGETVET